MSGRYPLSPYFGDYPHGRYVSAFSPPGPQFDDHTYQVKGVLRFRMPEDEVDFPLWDDNGLLPEEDELLASGLGISAALVADLKAWGAEWNRGGSDLERLRAEAGALVDRLRQEVTDGIEVATALE